MKFRITVIILTVLTIFNHFSLKLFSQNQISEIDSLGTIWVITIDNSGSMMRTIVGSKSEVANYVGNKIQQSTLFNSVDFEKDRFLFFGSGHLYRTINVHIIKSSGTFDKSFIHWSDDNEKTYSFSDKNALIDEVKTKILKADYPYCLSFVSQIRVFSLVKAMNYLKETNQTQIFKECKIITITDDADQNDQWRTDYRNLKDYAPDMLQSINETNVKYIYNQITSKGFGYLDEFFKSEDTKNVPHIWGYDYTTKQSLPEKADSTQTYFAIEASDGKNFTIKPLTNNYKGDDILFFRLDSIIINNEKHIVVKRFEDSLHLELNYKNGLEFNQFRMFGSFQILYTDSIYGEHYKKILFIQKAELPSAFLITTASISAIVLFILFSIFLIYRILVLPNKKLFVIYSNQGKKYVVKRGYKRHWQKGTIPVLSCILNENEMSVICKKHRNIKTQKFLDISDTQNIFLICSNRKLFSDETITRENIIFNNTQKDIEDLYKDRSRKYPDLLKYIYRKTTISKCRKYCCNSKYKWIRKIGNLIVSISNLLNQKYYYSIPKNAINNVSFYHNILQYRKFVIEFGKGPRNVISDINQNLNIECLNKYYDDTPNKPFDALLCYCIIKGKYIYWNVLLSEYEKDDSISLRFAYNTYQFRQDWTDNNEKRISHNLKLLKSEIKKQVKNCNNIKVYAIKSITQNNPHNFEITEVSCPGFLYLIEDTAKQKTQKLYSPFKDGLKEKKDVFVKKFKTEKCHLCLTFLPPTLIKYDNTLVRRVSDELININENGDVLLEIKNKKTVNFKNIIDTTIE